MTAYKLMEILEEAGLPQGVVNFVPGDPKEIGDYLVDHKIHILSHLQDPELQAHVFMNVVL